MKITENNPKLFQTIGDVFPTFNDSFYYFQGGSTRELLQLIIEKLGYPFINEDNFKPLLNYYTSTFNSRRLSIMFTRYIAEYGLKKSNLGEYYIPSLTCINSLSDIIKNIYSDKWNRIAEDFKLTYDVLKPLQMDSSYDTITDHMETTSNSDNSRNKSGTSADNNETEYDNTDNKIYGFNSTDGVNSDSSKNTSKDNSNSTFSSQDSYKGTDTYSRDANSQKTVTRSGNIGNRLPSEMILKEIEFRKNMLKDIIANDINSVLTRSKYI